MKDKPKYISIDYSDWENKYLPMEEELNRVKKELDEKDIKISFYITHRKYLLGFANKTQMPIYLNNIEVNDSLFDNNYGYAFEKVNNFKLLVKGVLDEVKMEVEEQNRRNKYAVNINTREEILHYEKEIKGAVEDLNRKTDYVESIIKENNNKLSNLPRIVKWLFGIKNI